MSLHRRLLMYLLVCAPLVWAVALFMSVDRARHEVSLAGEWSVAAGRRIAELHGLEVAFGAGERGQGVRVVLRFQAGRR
jgi:hypothetical protein